MDRFRAGLLGVMAAVAGTSARAGSPEALSYVPNSLVQSTVNLGPWTLHENDAHARHDASGVVPPAGQTAPPYTGTGTPFAGYCGSGIPARNAGPSPMQPFYFPYVRTSGALLQGFFDYRPRNADEATVSAISRDQGATWTVTGKALALNPYCPADPTDPDDLNVLVNGVKTPYGSNAANASDNGLGHPVALVIGGQQRLYTLDRASGHIDSDQLVVHPLLGRFPSELELAPRYGFVSPLASGGYPQLDAQAQATSGLVNPDAVMGTAATGGTTAVVYVSKALNADAGLGYPACPATPGFALTTLVTGKPRKANHDVTSVRVAVTRDGVHFTDIGAASGLSDPATTALNGIRYLGSGSILEMPNRHYGMFFGAGNCLDNDSDGFHFIGYAETVNPVNRPADLLQWRVVNGFDNPILSTDRVVDPATGRAYPAAAPVVSGQGIDLLARAQVAPFVPPAGPNPPPSGYDANFFSGRAYDPQANFTGPRTVTVVFAGYNTPQPSANLGDYRSIGRFKLQIGE